MLADLKHKTTYPPLLLTNPIALDTTLSPQAQRDTDTPDLGFHYSPLDYVAGGITLSATLTLTNGVALATYSDIGLALWPGGHLSSEGSPLNRNVIVRYNGVQEQSVTNWSSPNVFNNLVVYHHIPVSQVRVRFTDFHLQGNLLNYHLNQSQFGQTSFQDCNFYGGSTYSAVYSPVATQNLSFTNCLFHRVRIQIANQDTSGPASSLCLYNNLIYGGGLYLYPKSASDTWTFKDNFFDKATIGTYTAGTITTDYNGYLTGYNRLTPNGTHDALLSDSPGYQSGTLGVFYLPTGIALINAGSRTADLAGLYHYTTTTNQVKETNSIVDIGLHYVALDTVTLIPKDTDGDGLPDYFEDRNGNGTYDSAQGETDWNTSNSGQGAPSALVVFTPLK